MDEFDSLARITEEVVRFRDEREWRQFHGSKDQLLSLVTEVGELAEHFRWYEGSALHDHLRDRRAAIGSEMADVLYWLVLLAYDHDIDLTAAFREKMRENDRKYPASLARGSALKYDQLDHGEGD